VLAVGAAVAVTAWLGGRIAGRAAEEQLDMAYEVQRSYRDQRYQRLELAADLLSLDPYFAAYVVEAAGTADTASVLDLLAEYRREYDLAAVLTPDGRVLAHSERPDTAGEDLSAQPLVARALAEYGASGVWAEGGRLYDAVAVPVARGGELAGFLLIGFRIDDELARGVRDASHSQVAFFQGTGTELQRVGATLSEGRTRALVEALRARAAEIDPMMAGDDQGGRLTLDLGGRPWLALVAPLRDAAGEPIGTAATLASLDDQLATYRQLQWLLTGTGAAAVLLAVALAYPLTRRSLKPVRELAEAAEAARRGDYDRRIGDPGGDEVGRLAASFDDLLSGLREKRDMEAYMSHLSLSLPEPGWAGIGAGMAAERGPGPAAPGEPSEEAAPATAEDLVLLAAELRRHARAQADPEAAVEELQRDLDRAAAAVGAEGGRPEGALGHRLLASFAGGDAGRRALAVAASLVEGARREGTEPWELPAVALAGGPAARGALRWGEGRGRAVVGLPAARVETLLREASPGEVVCDAAVARGLEAVLGARGLALRPQKAILSSQRLYGLSGEDLARLAADLHATAGTVRLAELPDAAATRPQPRPAPALAPDRLAAGSVLGGRFEIAGVVGVGGMGVVYKARDRELEELVALKVLRRELWDREELRSRLKDELKLARRITHPNVLRTHDFGELDGVAFVSMEYVRGVTLRTLLDGAEEPLPFRAALRLARQIAAGLAAAHELGVVHRDIKPENVILDAAGNAKLMDFGIARPLPGAGRGTAESAYTRAGEVVGTPRYIAPERLRSEPADARSDVYSLGIVLYEVFAGRPPFPGGSIADIVAQHLDQEPPPPRALRPELPEELEAILLRSLAKAPAERYADAGALGKALDRVQG
jgi:serine/threonine-protein kinase